MTDYIDFKEALKRFVQEVCESLSRIPMPQRIWTSIVREGDGRTAYPQEERPDLTRLLMRLSVAMHTDPSNTLLAAMEVIRRTPKLAESVLVNGGGNPITEEKSQRWWSTNLICGPFLRAYFDHIEATLFDDRSFDEVFKQFINELRSSDITVSE